MAITKCKDDVVPQGDDIFISSGNLNDPNWEMWEFSEQIDVIMNMPNMVITLFCVHSPKDTMESKVRKGMCEGMGFVYSVGHNEGIFFIRVGYYKESEDPYFRKTFQIKYKSYVSLMTLWNLLSIRCSKKYKKQAYTKHYDLCMEAQALLIRLRDDNEGIHRILEIANQLLAEGEPKLEWSSTTDNE